MEWFPGGPKVDFIPLPIPDPTQPWGNESWGNKCSGFCLGHFLKPEEVLKSGPPFQYSERILPKVELERAI